MPKFKKGDPKPPNSGRKKGVPNIKVLLKAENLLTSLDKHPLAEIMKLIPKLSETEQVAAWLEIYKYVEPQKKSIEVLPAHPPVDQSRLIQSSTIELKAIAKLPDESESPDNQSE